ncbi:MAG TPA: two-component sensor histidine kinase [Propionibacteriaceae bacterium]|nr:two-component sensor histidine kinase [Propionibacteriaceae bacterium]HBY21995.1 two-component sensor histidine kinase [Propionibacteriaceae bacterium]
MIEPLAQQPRSEVRHLLPAYDQGVTPLSAALAGLLGGLLLGALIVALAVRGRLQNDATPTVTPDAGVLAEVVELLRTPAVICGEHDQVLAASPPAVDLGIARGQRLDVPEILFAVREVRRTRNDRDLTIDLPRRGVGPAPRLAVQVILLEGYVVVLAQDLTAIERADEARRDFVTNITHELKTPIGAIGLLSEAIEGATDDPEAVSHFAGRLQIETQRLNTLVSQLIALSRLQSDEPHLSSTPVNVMDVALLACDRCRGTAEDRDVELTLTGDSDVTLTADPEYLEVALTNLVQNAIAYSERNARVTVTVMPSSDEPGVDVAISDNGIGISEADQARIFDRFFRVDFARSREHGGTGLGLSIVRHVAEVHGGTVRVWSKPGQGSTFTLHLPLTTGTDAS